MTALWMPPLPEPLGELHYFSHQGHLFARTTNSAQLRQVQADAARAALEQAKKVCDDEARIREEAGQKHPEESDSRGRCFAAARAAINCVKGIDALAKEITP